MSELHEEVWDTVYNQRKAIVALRRAVSELQREVAALKGEVDALKAATQPICTDWAECPDEPVEADEGWLQEDAANKAVQRIMEPESWRQVPDVIEEDGQRLGAVYEKVEG